MLILFKVKNFTSFKYEAKLDMRATSYKQHKSHLLEYGKGGKLLKTAAIYGRNASGKSNFISAMYFFEQYIFNQFISKNEDGTEFEKNEFLNKLEPFQLASDQDDISEFEIIFEHNNQLFQYGFECTKKAVINEWYYIDDDKVFERKKSKLSFGSKYSKFIKQYTKIPKERVYLSVLDYFLVDEAKEIIIKNFTDFFFKKYHVFFEIFFESSIKSIIVPSLFSDELAENQELLFKVEKYLKHRETGEEKEINVVKTIHKVFNKNGNEDGEELFDLRLESTGTLRFLAYIKDVIGMVENGGVFIVDELSARLHPLLTKLIVDIFQASSNTKAQLIFTTHDISLLTKEQFRRDEVVFVDKNNRGESSIYSLSDLKVRDDASFSKDYMRGKYGAIPIFNYDEIFGGDIIE